MRREPRFTLPRVDSDISPAVTVATALAGSQPRAFERRPTLTGSVADGRGLGSGVSSSACLTGSRVGSRRIRCSGSVAARAASRGAPSAGSRQILGGGNARSKPRQSDLGSGGQGRGARSFPGSGRPLGSARNADPFARPSRRPCNRRIWRHLGGRQTRRRRWGPFGMTRTAAHSSTYSVTTTGGQAGVFGLIGIFLFAG